MPARAEFRIAIVIPAFQAAASLAGVVAGARTVAPVFVVDDGSTDGTGDVGRRSGATVLRHETNRGKGAALATGIAAARARSGAMPLGRRLTNWLSARLATRIAGQGVSDAQTGFRAFTREVAERVQPAGDRYDYETAFLLGACDAGYRVTCVAIPTIYAGATSHFRPWADTWRVARVFAQYARRIVTGPARTV